MKNQIRTILTDDIENLRVKIEFYKAHHLFEAARYADNLAENLELALTTMPRDEDQAIL